MSTEDEGNVEHLELGQLIQLMPSWLGGVSVGRAQLIVDQIRCTIEQSKSSGKNTDGKAVRPNWVWMATGKGASDRQANQHSDRLSLLAIQTNLDRLPRVPIIPEQPVDQQRANATCDDDEGSGNKGTWGDWATVLHGGFFQGLPSSSNGQSDDAWQLQQASRLAEQLSTAFLAEMRQRSVRFVQWATDPVPIQSERTAAATTISRPDHACRLLGFKSLATLQYMALTVDHQIPSSRETNGFQLRPIQWDQEQRVDELVDFVESTYFETLDCPAVNQFRSARQTLRSYQLSKVFDPDRWYRVLDAANQWVGVLIFATHSANVSELVYMALAPPYRGRGLGRPLVAAALSEVRRHHKSGEHRLLLAVDENNVAAKKLYEEKGFEKVLRETVWGRAVDNQTPSTSARS